MLNVVVKNQIVRTVYGCLLIFFMVLSTGFTQTTNLEKCLDNDPNEIRACLSKTGKPLTLSTCYAQADSIKSDFLRENLRLYCFYNISEFPTLQSCVEKAKLFIESENHDAALFDCYTKRQNRINKTTCNQIVNMFKIPEKGRYLKTNQCDELD